MNAHSRKAGARSLLQRFQCAHFLEETAGLRAQVLGAGLVTWERRPIEEENVTPRTREEKRRGRTRGTSTYDDDFRIVRFHQVMRSYS
jgi:hypothetical protein